MPVIKECVSKFREKLGLSVEPSYIEKTDLSPESNAFLNILAALASYFLEIIKTESDQRKLLKIGRESYEFLVSHFGGMAPNVIQNDFVINKAKVRLYKKDTSSDVPLILYAHGGGWTRGSLETHNTLCARLCHKTGFDVLAVGLSSGSRTPLSCCFR